MDLPVHMCVRISIRSSIARSPAAAQLAGYLMGKPQHIKRTKHLFTGAGCVIDTVLTEVQSGVCSRQTDRQTKNATDSASYRALNSIIGQLRVRASTYLLLMFVVSAAAPDEFPSAHIVFRMRLSRRRNSCDVLDNRKTDAAIGSRYLDTCVSECELI